MANEEQATFDVEFALNQFSRNQTLLVKMLERFCEQYQSFTEKLISYTSSNNHKFAKQEVHTLKGVSGNLGMKALHQSCREFEGVLRQQEISTADSSRLLDVMNTTMEQVRHFISGNNKAPILQEASATTSNDADASARQILLKALKRNEFISNNKLTSLMSDLSIPADTLQQLQVSIDDLDYEKALSLLE